MTNQLELRCPKCGTNLTPRELDSGGRVRCDCGAHFVPAAVASSSEPEARSVSLPAARTTPDEGAVAAPLPRSERLRGRVLNLAVETGSLRGALLIPLCALAVTALIYAFVWIVLRGSFAGAVLMHRGWVPYVVMFLSAWSGSTLLLKHRQLKRERHALNFDLLPTELGERISVENAGSFRAHVANATEAARGTLVVRRLQKALAHFETRGSGQELSEYLSRQSEQDQAAADGSYSMVRVFIWAIPILGFIGTVIGIGEAVGMFSSAIEATGELQAIKDSLGGVTTGLAWAFDTTLVALVMSLVVMLPASSLQTQEEQLVGAVDEYCDKHLVRRLSEPGEQESLVRVVQTAVEQGLDRHAQSMQAWTQRVEGVANTLADRLAAGWRRVQESSSAHYDELLGQVGAHHEDVLARYRRHHEDQLDHAGSVLKQARAESQQVTDATRVALTKSAESQARSSDRLEALLVSWQAQQAQLLRETAAATTRMSEVLAGAHAAMARDAEAARSAVESSLQSLAPEVEQRLAALAEQASQTWAAQLSRLGELQQRTAEELRETQAAARHSSEQSAQQLAALGEEFRSAVAAAGTELSVKLTESGAALQAQARLAGEAHAELLESQRAAASEATADLERASERVELRAAEGAAALSDSTRELVSTLGSRLEVTLERQLAAIEARQEQAETVGDATRRIAVVLERAQERLDVEASLLAGASSGHDQLVAVQRDLTANLELLARSDSLASVLLALDARLALLNEALTQTKQHASDERGRFSRFFRGSP